MEIIAKVVAPALAKIYDAINLFVLDSWKLRKQQAMNTARAKYDHQGAITATGWTDTAASSPSPAAGVGAWFAYEAQQEDQVFSALLFTTAATSGSGRYFITGREPTPAGAGFQLQTAGFQILIQGHENIKAFRVIAETGQTLNYTASLFQ